MMASCFTFEKLYRAYRDCLKHKRSKPAALAFSVNAEEHLLQLTRELSERTYRPSPSFCFVARNDKHREVFAAPFRDRVVHHLLVRRLEEIWERVFIFDSYACRKGKGIHAAVRRLQSFTRQVTANGTRPAWFMKLDIKAFFPSIDRRILLDFVLSRLPDKEMRWLAGIIIRHDPTDGAQPTCSPEKWRHVPDHKSLFSVPQGKGLPIGNLTSQFLANVYLNSLDQFVKHRLKVRYYLRYVDDLVLLSTGRRHLEDWKDDISKFLQEMVKLELNPLRQTIQPVTNGIEFLGYIVRPSHLLVRRRVVANCQRALESYSRAIVTREPNRISLKFPPKVYDALSATINSYLGIFRHAASHRLRDSIFREFALLPRLFDPKNFRAKKRWRLPFRPANLFTQYHFFRRRFAGMVLFQVGCYVEFFDQDAVWVAQELGLKRIPPRRGFNARAGVHLSRINSLAQKLPGKHLMVVIQSGKLTNNLA